MDTKDPVEVYKKLLKSMPSIGFINRNKRIRAYIKVTNLAQKMMTDNEITEDEALFILSLLAKKSNTFRKASTMTALSLNTLPIGTVKPVGFKYANAMRCNLNLHPADEVETTDD
ncbi:MAG: hypothetical protein Q9M50_04790 [Methylococcales bacterium]|nr:hypothetical protein [Methylococcales bacterium]